MVFEQLISSSCYKGAWNAFSVSSLDGFYFNSCNKVFTCLYSSTSVACRAVTDDGWITETHYEFYSCLSELYLLGIDFLFFEFSFIKMFFMYEELLKKSWLCKDSSFLTDSSLIFLRSISKFFCALSRT